MTETGSNRSPMDTLEPFDIGGQRQWALIRGRSRTAPVLLLIQAGPGFPMIHEAAALERQLGFEERFRVVYWDQRGTGKSFVARGDVAVTLAELVSDVRAMIRALCDRLEVSHVHVIGFSLGASLALLAAAEEPAGIQSLVCVGVDVNLLESERFAYAFALHEAERRRRRRALRALRAIGEPPHHDTKRFMTRLKWVSNFGGVHRNKTFGALLRANIARLWASPHYSIREMAGALRAMGATQARVLPALQGFDLSAKELRVAVPLAVFHGRHDIAAPPSLAADLAARLGASLVWFEESAHMPHEEEPRRFRDELFRFVRQVSDS